MECLLNFGPNDDDYEEFPGPEDDDDDGEENLAPEDDDPEDQEK
jgi:hypothetical protein